MARKMRKFADGGSSDRYKARYDRKVADIESDRQKALKGSRDKSVVEAKYNQRMADAKDDLAKWTGSDRTATRAGESQAEKALSFARQTSRAAPGTSRTSVLDAMDKTVATPKVDTARLSDTTKKQSFSEAFRTARKAGDKAFSWNGKSYNTQVKGESLKPVAPANKPKTPAKPAQAEAPKKPPVTANKPVQPQQKPPVTANKPSGFGDVKVPSSLARKPGMRAVNPALVNVTAAPTPPPAPVLRGRADLRDRSAVDTKRAATKAAEVAQMAKEATARKAISDAWSRNPDAFPTKKFAKGGSVDGCAIRGKTRAPMRRK